MAHSPAGPSIARTPDGLFVAARPLNQVSVILEVWRRLARHLLVENLFYEADFVLAAAEAFGDGIHVLTVSDRPPEEPGARLLALWPCRIVRRWGVPLPALMGWTHGFSIFGPPLLDRNDAEAGLRALIDAPRLLRLPRRLLMPYLPLDGAFAVMLERILVETGRRRRGFWEHERGFLDLTDRPIEARETYLATHLSARKARQVARLSRRISSEAPVEHEIVRRPEALGVALADYLALEAAGWKGRNGTAVAQHPAQAAFLTDLIESYGATGRVRIDRLRRDKQSLAASVSFETDTTFWFLKIAHDETEGKNSPGALLVDRVTRSLLADRRIVMADSCAPPNFSLIETFWADRRRLAHGLIEAGGGDRLFPAAVALEHLRARASRTRLRFSRLASRRS